MRGDFLEVTYGYCKCGCGEQTKIATKTRTKDGCIKGEPKRFLKGHNIQSGKHASFYGKTGKDHPTYGLQLSGKDHPRYGKTGRDCPAWKGGKTLREHGNTTYVLINIPEHPRSCNNYVFEHIVVMEKIISGPLPEGAVVHHIDGNGLNNDESNLMLFLNSGEHTKFHAKLRRIYGKRNNKRCSM